LSNAKVTVRGRKKILCGMEGQWDLAIIVTKKRGDMGFVGKKGDLVISTY